MEWEELKKVRDFYGMEQQQTGSIRNSRGTIQPQTRALRRQDNFFSIREWKVRVSSFLGSARKDSVTCPEAAHQEELGGMRGEELDYYKRFWDQERKLEAEKAGLETGSLKDYEHFSPKLSKSTRLKSALKKYSRSCTSLQVNSFCGLSPCKFISALLLLTAILLAVLIPTVFIKNSSSNKDAYSDSDYDSSDSNQDGSALPSTAIKLPLLRSSRWITDSNGRRVKLQCTSWQSHLEAMIPEGLALQNVDNLAALFPKMGLNCVRFTYATMFTTESTLLVKDSVQRARLSGASTSAIERINPDIWGISLFDLYLKVFKALENNGIMVILDNHISTPQWCCMHDDGDRWWGEANFSVSAWTNGLTFVAKNYGSLPNVVGFSLRNEPSKVDNHAELQRYMRMGALAVHEASPSSLIIMSGITSATNLVYESRNPITASLPQSLQQKFLYEAHQYSFFAQVNTQNLDSSCLRNQAINKANIFNVLTDNQGAPLFISEWGEKTVNFNPAEPWFNCFYRDLLTLDLDNAIWPFASVYYRRTGALDEREEWSLGNADMTGAESDELISKLKVLSMIRKDIAVVHSRSTTCLQPVDEKVVLGVCEGGKSDNWSLENAQMVYLPNGKCVSKSLRMVECTSSDVAVVTQSSDSYRLAIDQGCLSSTATFVGDGSVTISPCRPNDLDQWFIVANTTLRG